MKHDQAPTEKLQKILAAKGLGSRREIEKWISAGRVRINGRQAKLGDRAGEADIVELDGRRVQAKPQTHRVIIYHKPEGEVSTRRDPEGRPTVFDRLPKLKDQRWVAVGRLDINTSGLLLLTTDGELGNRLMHPSSAIDREYMTRIFGNVDDTILHNLRTGVELDDGPASFSDITELEQDSGQNRWYCVCLKEGRNREVRRLWESQGLMVNRLKRVRYGPILLPSYVRQGQWLDLPPADVKLLYRTCDMKPPALSLKLPQERVKWRRQEKKIRAGGRQR